MNKITIRIMFFMYLFSSIANASGPVNILWYDKPASSWASEVVGHIVLKLAKIAALLGLECCRVC